MSLYYRQLAVLAAREASYGVAPTLAGADAVLLRNVNFGPFAATKLDRGVVRPYMGTSPALMTQVHRTLDCELDLAGSGAAGTAPAWGPWARAAALAETVTAGAKVEYTPVSANFDSLAVWFGIDDQKHLMTGALAKLDLSLPAGGLPTLKWSGAGLWSAVTAVAPPVPDYSHWKDPVEVNSLNTSFSLHGYPAVMKSLTLSSNADPGYLERVGSAGIRIGNRPWSGTVEFELPKIAAFDVQTLAKAGTTGALAVTHGLSAGNTIEIDAPHVQIAEPKYAKGDKDIWMVTASLLLLPGSAGNDEIRITVK